MSTEKKIKVLIAGAGKAGSLIKRDLKASNQSFEVVGFLDDFKEGTVINGEELNVLGKIADIGPVVKDNQIDEIIIAMPSGRGKVIRQIVDGTVGQKVTYKILPMKPQVLMQELTESYLSYIRELRVEDLLGGEIHKEDQEDISKSMAGKTIMITGAAGSIGSELSSQITAHGAKKVILYDWWENGMFELRNRLENHKTKTELHYIIGDIKDQRKVAKILKDHQPDAIFHAAAYKHVPLMESNPTEAIKNNILGTKVVAEAAIEAGVSNFVLISSDKAVNPTNVMGATKRAAEKVVHILSQGQTTTKFSAVRFGNVINSNGSVIPIFMRQINSGGPVTVTHQDITRFFMTIPEAVHLILQSWLMGENNDLFVLDMGEPVKIYDLAKSLISLQGYTPEKDIKVEFTGLRPGEKLYEEVLVKEEEVSRTAFDKIFKTKNYMSFEKDKFLATLSTLLEHIDHAGDIDDEQARSAMQQLISTYQPKHSGE